MMCEASSDLQNFRSSPRTPERTRSAARHNDRVARENRMTSPEVRHDRVQTLPTLPPFYPFPVESDPLPPLPAPPLPAPFLLGPGFLLPPTPPMLPEYAPLPI